jgi:outer membrane protein assembly factor BamB
MNTRSHVFSAFCVAVALSAGAMADDLIWNQVGSPVAAGQPSSDFVAPWQAWDVEVADDFDIVGVVTEVWAIGVDGPFSSPGVWVRFYDEGPDGKPGNLLVQHAFSASDSNLLLNQEVIHVILPEPLSVDGRIFVSVQQQLNSGSSNPSVASFWTWTGTLNGFPNGDPSYIRNPGGGWGTICTSWCQTNADRIFKLYGTLDEKPPSPPPPIIAALASATVTPSGRFIVTGTHFTDDDAPHQLLLNGNPTPHAAWSDTEIHGYVLGDAPLGTATVQVVTAGGVSNSMAIEIVPAPLTEGRVRWRFMADHINVSHRAAFGADGMVYFSDSGGNVYAVSATGGLAWIFNMVGGGNQGPVAVGADGTIYVAGNPLGPDVVIHALHPDGSLRWTFTDTNNESVIAGPSVGPDGNLYVVTDIGGLGAFSLAPDGSLLWNNTGNPTLTEYAQIGAEIVFGPSQLDGPIDRFYVAFDELQQFDDRLFSFSLDGQQQFSVVTGTIDDPAETQVQAAVAPQGPIYVSDFGPGGGNGWRLKSFSPVDGSINWTLFDSGTNTLTSPTTGPDGTVYVIRNLNQIHALRPDGSQRWLEVGGGIYDVPVVHNQDEIMLVGGVPSFGMAGFMQARRTRDGSVLWQVDLPYQNGGHIVPASRTMFSPAGDCAVFGAAYLASDPQGQYSYVYSIDLSDPPAIPGDLDGDGDVDAADLAILLGAWGSCGACPADLDGDGDADGADLAVLLGHWGQSRP